ncbi:hypothetical protein SPRG_15777 [Saprolegnia parasitica CBS 223.65]|uniref:Uncharacterized protein n=1 Tax=Saprolegnia parasitica (strain CBS 223.65) TaxID=695850 RepID=A0A067BXD4_SAPPC|nr:hypothetical protein SPRG_15777 [Saprolegnia parasitica CBS 223.65]KDO18986.1 hypothetical protein SPRG_15777 [Saprolegnia parasitica CBS 223.65]|eukprot:XP_012210303.1 hypothetical protein SPRG_15777 [Saprolegnia parasitica CBS 223.65]
MLAVAVAFGVLAALLSALFLLPSRYLPYSVTASSIEVPPGKTGGEAMYAYCLHQHTAARRASLEAATAMTRHAEWLVYIGILASAVSSYMPLAYVVFGSGSFVLWHVASFWRCDVRRRQHDVDADQWAAASPCVQAFLARAMPSNAPLKTPHAWW